MLAYHNDPKIKTAILAQLQAHYDADEIIKGIYWQGGKGCAVGCLVHGSSHAECVRRFGGTEILYRLLDRIFEGLPNGSAKEFPLRFMRAIKPGADLAGVWPKFTVWLLADEARGVIRFAKTDEQHAMIREVTAAFTRGETDRAVWRDIWDRARVVRHAAADAAYAAADAADAADDAAYAAYAVAYAADAAYAAAYAAYAAYYAADAAYAAAYAADVADADAADAAYAARHEHYVAEADKLIELLQAA